MSDYSDNIRSLNARDLIRLRPNMYIGAKNKTGVGYLLSETLQNLCEKNNPNTALLVKIKEDIITLKFKGTELNKIFSDNFEDGYHILTEVSNKMGLKNNSFPAFAILTHLSAEFELKCGNKELIKLKNDAFETTPSQVNKTDWLTIQLKLDQTILEEIIPCKYTLAAECRKLPALCSNVEIEFQYESSGEFMHEKHTMQEGLIGLFKNKLDQQYKGLHEEIYYHNGPPIFHVKVDEPSLSLEVAFAPTQFNAAFNISYYCFTNLVQGGSHTSYFDQAIKELFKEINQEHSGYYNKLENYNLMTVVESDEQFTYLGPTKSRIEAPALVQIMKKAFDKLKPEIMEHYHNN